MPACRTRRAVRCRTKGRLRPGSRENDVRTCYQRDTDRILHSKSFRRLMHKTQVFLKPEGDHYRTRMTHTLEVARIARTITRGLRLNEDLVEASALRPRSGSHAVRPRGRSGADGGHGRAVPPQRAVSARCRRAGEGRAGPEPDLRAAGWGSSAIRDSFIPETLEGQIVRISDRIAYINHDIDDAMRAGILCNATFRGPFPTCWGRRIGSASIRWWRT